MNRRRPFVHHCLVSAHRFTLGLCASVVKTHKSSRLELDPAGQLYNRCQIASGDRRWLPHGNTPASRKTSIACQFMQTSLLAYEL